MIKMRHYPYVALRETRRDVIIAYDRARVIQFE